MPRGPKQIRRLPFVTGVHPLRQAINDVLVQWVTTKLQKGEPEDVAFMAREITHSLNDMVLEQDEKHQGPLLAHIVG